MSNWVKISLNCTTIRQISQSFYVLRIPVQYVVLFTQSYIEKYKELSKGGGDCFPSAKHSYIYDAERKSMIIGGNGR